MKNRNTYTSIALLLLLPSILLPSVLANERTYNITMEVPEYINQLTDVETRVASFFMLVSHPNSSITWWSGGIEFVYYPGSPEYAGKVDALKRGILFTLREIGFIFPYGTFTIHRIDLHIVFSGVIQYIDYVFVDGRGGEIHVSWSENYPLTIRVTAMATALVDTVASFHSADWGTIRNGASTIYTLPKTEVKLKPGSRYTLLGIPREGPDEQTHVFNNFYGRPLPPSYLGASPTKLDVTADNLVAGYVFRSWGFFSRAPLYTIKFTAAGPAYYKNCYFWESQTQVQSIPEPSPRWAC